MSENRYLIKNTDDIVTPALIYYEDIILSNIREMISVAGGTERLCACKDAQDRKIGFYSDKNGYHEI